MRKQYEKHGLSYSDIYTRWESMKDRCYNPNCRSYKYYGGKGIYVCDEWLQFSNFYKWSIENGFQKHLEIDRRDGTKNYTPENCRYIPKSDNARNIPSQRKSETWGIIPLKNGSFYVRIHHQGNLTSVGSYSTQEEAIKERDRFVRGERGAYIKRKDVGIYPGKWGFVTHVVKNKKCYHVGTYKTKEEAIIKRDLFAASL